MSERSAQVREAVRYLDAIPKFTKEKHSMDKLRRMLALLGAQPRGKCVIHVAGTNGKGSVCAFLAAALREAGQSPAVFTSPHLVTVRERFSFDGHPVEEETFLQAYREIRQAEAAFLREGLGHPTYFEFLFLMFMCMVRDSRCSHVILETGLGGRLDATNCLERPDLTIITSISLDHMEYLGNTAAQIAGEKAGILKPGVPVVYDAGNPEAAAVIRERARRLGCPAVPVSAANCLEKRLEKGGLSFLFSAPGDGEEGKKEQGDSRESERNMPERDGGSRERKRNMLERDGDSRETGCREDVRQKEIRQRLFVPFEAEYQAVNGALAFQAARILGLPAETAAAGIGKSAWPGRMEQVRENVYLDGAHNEGGIREFIRAAGAIRRRRESAGKTGRLILLFSVVSDKEYREMVLLLLRELRPEVLILTQLQSGRGLDVQELSGAVARAAGDAGPGSEDILPDGRAVGPDHGNFGQNRVDAGPGEAKNVSKTAPDIRIFPGVPEALRAALAEKRPEDTVFCAGSLYLIGEIKEALEEE